MGGKIQTAQIMEVTSWCTYPVVYLFPTPGIEAASAGVYIQEGYRASDTTSRCSVGIPFYLFTYAKSNKAGLLGWSRWRGLLLRIGVSESVLRS